MGLTCRLAIGLATTVAISGCEDFATPADLDRPQILAIASEPASVEPGDRARLSILVADPDGEVEVPEVTWRIVPAPGQPQLGELETEEDGSTWYTAPDEIAENPTGEVIEAVVTVGDVELTGVKAMVVGSIDLRNPTVVEVRAAGSPLADADVLTVDVGDIVEIDLSLDPPATEDVQVAWFSNVLHVEKYKSAPTDADAPDDRGGREGIIFAVARDRGGVGWLSRRVRIR